MFGGTGAAEWSRRLGFDSRGTLCIFQGQGLAVSHGVPWVRHMCPRASEFSKTVSCIFAPCSWDPALGSVPPGQFYFTSVVFLACHVLLSLTLEGTLDCEAIVGVQLPSAQSFRGGLAVCVVSREVMYVK